MIKAIRRLGDSVLRNESKPVEKFDDSLRELIQNMIESLHSARGVGLAAPQIGVNLQIAVIELDEKALLLINPEVKKAWGREISEEGCLSIPGLREQVQRSTNLIVQTTSLDQKIVEFEAEGLLARAIQHEIDHLQGVLFIDRISKARRLQLKRILARIEAGETIEETEEGSSS